MDILGISAYYHDSAACLVRDGKIIASTIGYFGLKNIAGSSSSGGKVAMRKILRSN